MQFIPFEEAQHVHENLGTELVEHDDRGHYMYVLRSFPGRCICTLSDAVVVGGCRDPSFPDLLEMVLKKAAAAGASKAESKSSESAAAAGEKKVESGEAKSSES